MSTHDAHGYEGRFRFLEEKLRPIANRPVKNIAALAKTMGSRPRPIDEAGVRSEAESLIGDVLETYAMGSDEDRQVIRDLFGRYRAVSWAIPRPSQPPTTELGFRAWLLMISVRDQSEDSRDLLVALSDKCRTAAKAGVIVGPILQEVAWISSDEDRHGFGSMRSMLLSAEGAAANRDRS